MAPIQMKARAPSRCSQPTRPADGATGAAPVRTPEPAVPAPSALERRRQRVRGRVRRRGCGCGLEVPAQPRECGTGRRAPAPAASSICRRSAATSSASRRILLAQARRADQRHDGDDRRADRPGDPRTGSAGLRPRRPPLPRAAVSLRRYSAATRWAALDEVGAAVLGDLAALHHQAVVLLARGALDVGQRIAVAQHEVGRVAFLDAALVGQAHQVGGAGRREEQRIAGRDADLAHELELARVLAVPVVRRAGVGAHRDACRPPCSTS